MKLARHYCRKCKYCETGNEECICHHGVKDDVFPTSCLPTRYCLVTIDNTINKDTTSKIKIVNDRSWEFGYTDKNKQE